jgi:hypothetical protein
MIISGGPMWLFLKRFFGWYLWLGIYTSAIGALVGMLCFSFPLLPLLIVAFFGIFPAGLVFAAPLNLIILPVAFHLCRNSTRRAVALRLTGLLGGFVSPTLGGLTWDALHPNGPVTFVTPPADLSQLWQYWSVMVAFGAVGAIAGIICARLFHKHGDRASVFDVNAALDSMRA